MVKAEWPEDWGLRWANAEGLNTFSYNEQLHLEKK